MTVKFSYRATDTRGDLQRGNLTAENEAAARKIVESKGWLVLEMRPHEESQPVNAAAALASLSTDAAKVSERPKAPAALALLLLIPVGLVIFWPKSSISTPAVTTTPAMKHTSKSITVQGVMPIQTVDTIHITCMTAAVQIDRQNEVKPGQPFSCLVEVPQESGDILIEMSHSGHRWPLGTIHPQDSPNLVLASIQVPEFAMNNAKPYQSHFASAKNSKLPTPEETRRDFEDRQRQESEIRRQRSSALREPR